MELALLLLLTGTLVAWSERLDRRHSCRRHQARRP